MLLKLFKQLIYCKYIVNEYIDNILLKYLISNKNFERNIDNTLS